MLVWIPLVQLQSCTSTWDYLGLVQCTLHHHHSPGLTSIRSLHPPVSQHGQLIALPFTAQEAAPLQPSVAAASANLSSRANSLIAVVLRVGKMISQVPVRAPNACSFAKGPPILNPPFCTATDSSMSLSSPPGRVESQRCSTRTYGVLTAALN